MMKRHFRRLLYPAKGILFTAMDSVNTSLDLVYWSQIFTLKSKLTAGHKHNNEPRREETCFLHNAKN